MVVAASSRMLAVLAAVSMAACASTLPLETPTSASLACDQLGDTTKAAAPFYERGSVYAARPIRRTVSRTRAFDNQRVVGAELYLRAEMGVTREYLQRALSCHAVAPASADPTDPLHPRGRVDQLTVRSTSAGFAVAVTSADEATAEDIWQRSRAFAGHRD